MRKRTVHIDGTQIHDRDSFHDEFARSLGFPGFYGRNMDAWIDCLTSADEDDGMLAVCVGPGGVLTLQIDGYAGFKKRCPELALALHECAAFVNWRRIEVGDEPVLALSITNED